jgi:hypothetical protein
MDATPHSTGLVIAALCKAAGSAHSYTYPLAGRLRLTSTGWLLLAVPAALVRGIYDALHRTGYELPPEFGIPVMTPTEVNEVGRDKIVQRGHSFSYTLGTLRDRSTNYGGHGAVLYLEVSAPELRKLRLSYKLPEYPQQADGFRLPLALRPAGVWLQKASAVDDEIDWDAVERELQPQD